MMTPGESVHAYGNGDMYVKCSSSTMTVRRQAFRWKST